MVAACLGTVLGMVLAGSACTGRPAPRTDTPASRPPASVATTHAVAMEWSADGATLVFRDRNGTRQCGPNGCALDVATGTLTQVPYDAFFATQGVEGQAFEVVDLPGSRPTRLVTHREGAAPTSVDLDHSTAPSTAGGPVADTHVAFAQCPNRRRSRDTDGVVVVDPSDGAVLAMLTAPRRGGQCILGAQTWLTARTLLVSDWVEGDLWSWDVGSGRVLRMATSPVNGLNVSVAREVLARRLTRGRDVPPSPARAR